MLPSRRWWRPTLRAVARRSRTTATPPAFLWHTADDGAVPVENTFAYARSLIRNGVPAEVHVFPHGSHGLGLAGDEPGPDQWTALCAAWLGRLGWISV